MKLVTLTSNGRIIRLAKPGLFLASDATRSNGKLFTFAYPLALRFGAAFHLFVSIAPKNAPAGQLGQVVGQPTFYN